MVHSKNYETVSTFVKVMQRKLWPLFSGHSVDGTSQITDHLQTSTSLSIILESSLFVDSVAVVINRKRKGEKACVTAVC